MLQLTVTTKDMLINIFRFAVRQFSNRSQMTSNKRVAFDGRVGH